MKEINTGGPAFPVVAENGLGHVADGMTLRDWFAGKALVGLLAEPIARGSESTICYLADSQPGDTGGSRIARAAYLMADGMIAARGAA